jgi:hypothetical protein
MSYLVRWRTKVKSSAPLKFRIVFWVVLQCKIIVDRRFRGTRCLHHQVCTSETSVDNYFTRQYIPEDNSELHTRRRENLKSHIFSSFVSGTKVTQTCYDFSVCVSFMYLIQTTHKRTAMLPLVASCKWKYRKRFYIIRLLFTCSKQFLETRSLFPV